MEALKSDGELFGIAGLAECTHAQRLIERFIEITEYKSPEEVAILKSAELAGTLWEIGMRIDPGQFGIEVLQSTQEMVFLGCADDDKESEDIPHPQSEDWNNSPVCHRLAIDLTQELDDYVPELDALASLHKASEVLGLPRDYFVKRQDFSISGPEKPAGPIADGRPDKQVNPMYRPPKIETLTYLLEPTQIQSLWRLVNASCLQDDENEERQDMGRTSTTQETQAIRELIRKVEIDDQFKNSGEKFGQIWKTLTEILWLVDCQVSEADVRQVYNRLQADLKV